MKKDYRNKGFTLVEMIVVIVIIGILLAILVPGMFKYIQKAKEQQAIVECRAVVTAAQTLVLELYAKDKFEADVFLTKYEAEILNSAGVNGRIDKLQFNNTKLPPTIEYLKYITKGKITVIYDLNNGSIYYIEDIFSLSIRDKVEKAQNIYDNSTGKSAWEDTKKEFYNSDSALLEEKEKEILRNGGKDPNSYKWKPCKYIDPETGKDVVFLCACTAASGNQNTPLVLLASKSATSNRTNIYN